MILSRFFLPARLKTRKALALSAVLLVLVTASFIGFITSASAHETNGPAVNSSRISGAIVIAWNQELLHIVQTPGAQPATLHPTRSYAIMHAAIYDAIVSITRNAPPFLFSVTAARGARPDAAAAEAGHDVLVTLYPAFQAELDKQLVNELAAIPNGASKQHGIQVGHTIARIWIAIRADDGSAVTPPPFVPGNQPGNYRPTPPNFPAPAFTNWSRVQPFVLSRADQFRPAPPPALTSKAYAQALNEVESLGQDTSTTRTPEQTTIGKFWGAPIWNTWNEIADTVALAHHTNLETTARMFEELNLTFADSTIAFYDAKYHYQLWRPITAIRLADIDGNPATIANPNWNALTVTAPDPSYPGAHSAISEAGAVVLTAFFGRHDSFQLTSDVLPGVTRSFNSFAAAAEEAGLSRIYAGQHTRLDHVAGVELGSDVAHFVLFHLNDID
ncbi:MAG TPA: vanadium-dependent haloperoxidase [Ktedonobacteraceae bacterium]|nr:vanadium-dependent haloperoxidase [Ktedonobacteraceae bacterium]